MLDREYESILDEYWDDGDAESPKLFVPLESKYGHDRFTEADSLANAMENSTLPIAKVVMMKIACKVLSQKQLDAFMKRKDAELVRNTGRQVAANLYHALRTIRKTVGNLSKIIRYNNNNKQQWFADLEKAVDTLPEYKREWKRHKTVCVRGHDLTLPESFVTGRRACKVCHNASIRRWDKKNHQKRLEAQRKRRAKLKKI